MQLGTCGRGGEELDAVDFPVAGFQNGSRGRDGIEVKGFPLTPTLRHDIESMGMKWQNDTSVRQVLVWCSDDAANAQSEFAEFRESLRASGIDFELEISEGERVWVKDQDALSQALVPRPTLEAMVSWISTTAQ